MTIQRFEDIIAWRKSHQLVLNIYEITKNFPREEAYALTQQMRRCSISVPANIAEGFKRRTKNDSLHFYNISEASLEELKYYLILSKDLKYINEGKFNSIYCFIEEVSKIINGWKKIQK